jgi:hypothetical protein
LAAGGAAVPPVEGVAGVTGAVAGGFAGMVVVGAAAGLLGMGCAFGVVGLPASTASASAVAGAAG